MRHSFRGYTHNSFEKQRAELGWLAIYLEKKWLLIESSKVRVK